MFWSHPLLALLVPGEVGRDELATLTILKRREEPAQGSLNSDFSPLSHVVDHRLERIPR